MDLELQDSFRQWVVIEEFGTLKNVMKSIFIDDACCLVKCEGEGLMWVLPKAQTLTIRSLEVFFQMPVNSFSIGDFIC